MTKGRVVTHAPEGAPARATVYADAEAVRRKQLALADQDALDFEARFPEPVHPPAEFMSPHQAHAVMRRIRGSLATLRQPGPAPDPQPAPDLAVQSEPERSRARVEVRDPDPATGSRPCGPARAGEVENENARAGSRAEADPPGSDRRPWRKPARREARHPRNKAHRPPAALKTGSRTPWSRRWSAQ